MTRKECKLFIGLKALRKDWQNIARYYGRGSPERKAYTDCRKALGKLIKEVEAALLEERF